MDAPQEARDHRGRRRTQKKRNKKEGDGRLLLFVFFS